MSEPRQQVVDLPVVTGRRLLAGAAQSAGYPATTALELVEAALRLERIGALGVQSMLAYLMLTSDLPFSERQPRRAGSEGWRCVCPVLAANMALTHLRENGLPDGAIALNGPAAPVLMMPMLADYAASLGLSVRLHAYGARLLFGAGGFRFEGDTFGYFPAVDAAAQTLNAVEFVPLEAFPPRPILASIRLPRARLSASMDAILL